MSVKTRSGGIVVTMMSAMVFLPAVAQEQPAEPEGQPVALDAESPPASQSWLNGWTGSVALGFNGAEGNTERFAFRAVANARRTVEAHDTTFSLLYAYAQDNGNDSESRFEANARNDWLFKDSRWRIFAIGRYEFDNFQDWDHRISFFAGPAYEFIKNDTTFLLGRVGAGVTREFGGEDNTWTPEGLIGADFEHAFTERQKLTATAEFFPALDDFDDYRFEIRAAYEIVVDPSNGLTLRLGAENRYDSTPGSGFKRNDISYFALLAWNF